MSQPGKNVASAPRNVRLAHPSSRPRAGDGGILNSSTIRELFPELTVGLSDAAMKDKVTECQIWRDASYQQQDNANQQNAPRAGN
jgi:hypothetical protein